jgi:hypothetical protein
MLRGENVVITWLISPLEWNYLSLTSEDGKSEPLPVYLCNLVKVMHPFFRSSCTVHAKRLEIFP